MIKFFLGIGMILFGIYLFISTDTGTYESVFEESVQPAPKKKDTTIIEMANYLEKKEAPQETQDVQDDSEEGGSHEVPIEPAFQLDESAVTLLLDGHETLPNPPGTVPLDEQEDNPTENSP